MKIKAKKNIVTLAVYLLAVIALYPIARYLVVFKLDLLPGVEDGFIVARVFFSGPVLILTGLILFFQVDKKILNRAFGFCFTSIGLIWMFKVAQTIIQEAA